MEYCCAICGCKRTADAKSPRICHYLCYWILEGWIGFNARDNKVAIRDTRAVSLFPDVLSYPKTIRAARAMGWAGREDIRSTFVQVQPKPVAQLKAAAKGAGA
jgi:hypothetical protein